MTGARIVVGDNHLPVFLIFAEVPEQRFALLRYEGDCCFLGIGCSQVVGERLEQRGVLFAIERGLPLFLCGYLFGRGG